MKPLHGSTLGQRQVITVNRGKRVFLQANHQAEKIIVFKSKGIRAVENPNNDRIDHIVHTHIQTIQGSLTGKTKGGHDGDVSAGLSRKCLESVPVAHVARKPTLQLIFTALHERDIVFKQIVRSKSKPEFLGITQHTK